MASILERFHHNGAMQKEQEKQAPVHLAIVANNTPSELADPAFADAIVSIEQTMQENRHIGQVSVYLPAVSEGVETMLIAQINEKASQSALLQHPLQEHVYRSVPLQDDELSEPGVFLVKFGADGREDVLTAIRELVAMGIPKEEITDQRLTQQIHARYLPDETTPPDLIIFTNTPEENGIQFHNHMIWDTAYSEFAVTPLPLQEMTGTNMLSMSNTLAERERKFGGLPQKK